MSPLFVTLCFMIALLILSRSWWLSSGTNSFEAQERLESILERNRFRPEEEEEEDEGEKSPLVNRLAARLEASGVLKNEEALSFLEKLDSWLVQAGLRTRFNPMQAIAYALIIWTMGIFIPLFLSFSTGFPPPFLLAIVVIFSALYPPLKLRSTIRDRQDTIRSETPFFIQQLYMVLSTGMATIDEAIVRVGRTAKEDPYDSVLAAEFGQAQIEYRLGAKSFEAAIRDVGRRTQVLAVENLCEAIVQGYRTGTSMDKVLLEYSSQAQEMWRQDMRSYKNKKEPMVTIGLVITMGGAFVIWMTPIALDLLNSLSGI